MQKLQRSRFKILPVLGGVVVLGIIFWGVIGRSRATPKGAASVAETEAQPWRSLADRDLPVKAGLLTVSAEAMELAEIEVAPAERQTVTERLSVVGEVEPSADRTVEVTPRAAGKVTSVTATVGDTVQAGQILATLSSTELAAAQAEYRQALARVQVARTHLNRQRQLGRMGEFSRGRVEAARREVAEAQGQVEEAQSAVAAAKSEVAQAESDRAAAESEVVAAESEVTAAAGGVTGAESEVVQAQGEVAAREGEVAHAKSVARVAESEVAAAESAAAAAEEEVANARSAVQIAQGELANAESEVAAAEGEVAHARAELRSAESAVAYAESEVAEAESAVAEAEAQVIANQEAVTQARSRLEVARSWFKKLDALLKDELVARQEWEQAKANVQQAEAEVRTAEAGVTQAKARWRAAQAKLKAAQSGVTNAQAKVQVAQAHVAIREAKLQAAQAHVATQRAKVEAAQAQLRTRQAQLQAAQANVAAAQARLQAAQAQTDTQQARTRSAQATVGATQAKVTTAQAGTRALEAKVKAAQAKVQQAAAHVESARAQQRQAEARLAAAQKRLVIAQQALAREEQIFRKGLLTSKEIVAAEAFVQEAELAREAAAEKVRLLGGAPGGGPMVSVTAPIAGRVQTRTVSPGQTVSPEKTLFTLVNLDLVWVQLSLPSRDLPRVREGQMAELTTDAVPGRTFTGVVTNVSDTADEKTRAVQVRVALPNPDRRLKPGMFMRGDLLTDRRRERVVVPVGALQEHNGKPTVYVFVGREGEGRGRKSPQIPLTSPSPPSAFFFEVRHVKLGEKGKDWQEITEGLDGGEPIAIQGTFFLKSEALKDSLSDSCCAAPE